MSKFIKTKTSSLIAFALYHAYFLLVFLQFPLNNSLPGNTDTIYNLAIFKDYGNRIIAFFTNLEIGNALYPAKMMQQYAELYLGEAAIFLFFDLFSNNDIITYFLFIATLYALNGLGMFLFINYLVKNKLVALVAGFLFSSSTFAFSQVELLNGIPYFFFFLSLLYFLKYANKPILKYLVLSSLFAALQFYFSNYIVLYLFAIFSAYIFLSKYHLLFKTKFYLHFILAIVSGFIALLPYLYIADFGIPILGANNPLTLELIPKFSIKVSDLWRHFPNHYLYNFPAPLIPNETVKMVHYTFSGFTFIVFLIAAVLRLKFKNYKWWLLILFTALIVSMGPVIQWPGASFDSPISFVFTEMKLYKFMRIPARVYSLVLIAAIVIISYFLANQHKTRRLIFALVLCSLYFFENVPKSFYHPDVSFIKPPKELIQFFDTIENKNDIVIAFLPSSIFTGKPYNQYGVSEFNREYTYAYWQTYLKVNVVNGMCGFCPDSRLKLNEILVSKQVQNMFNSINASHLIMIKNPKFYLEGDNLYNKGYNYAKVIENKQFVIYGNR